MKKVFYTTAKYILNITSELVAFEIIDIVFEEIRQNGGSTETEIGHHCIHVVPSTNDLVLIALTFGLAVFVIIQTIGHISGGHVNPAVTAGMLVTGKIPIIRGFLYIVVQCVGALVGTGILKAVTPDKVQGSLGLTDIQGEVSPVQGFGMEFMLGFILVFVVFGVCDENRHENKSIGPLAIGLAVTLGHLAALDYTGSSMNPARTFGSAVISNQWANHWIFWVGPILGGIAASLIYTFAFVAPVPTVRIIERYTSVLTDEKELRRLDGNGSKAEVA
ncbi:prip [Carabus blaptoides fortunei]